MSKHTRNATLSKNTTLSKINYREYMFAIISAFLPGNEGNDLRRISGSLVFRHEDKNGYTYMNGLLHSYDDKPATINKEKQLWYKNGKRHREGDLPAVINGHIMRW